MNEMQQEIWDALCWLSGEDVLRLITDWLGLQVLDEEFREFLADEGVMPEVEEENEEEEIESDFELGDDFEGFCLAQSVGCFECPLRRTSGDCEDIWENMKKGGEEQ